MGYLADKQKERAEHKTYETVKVKDMEGAPFRFEDVRFADISGQFGTRRTAVCTIDFGNEEEKRTVFIDKSVIVRTLEEGVRDGHDWKDGVFYVLSFAEKKSGNGNYWAIDEA